MVLAGPLHATSALLPPVLAAATLVSGTLVALALAAFARRQSRPYLLVVLALATLLARSALGVLTVEEFIDIAFHHLLEHGLDVVTVVLLVGAIYLARTTDVRGEYA